MKSILLGLLMMVSISAYSQVLVEGTNINELDIQYCELIIVPQGLTKSKLIFSIDYGEKYKVGRQTNISSVDGSVEVFNTAMDALNFMEKNGWEYLHNYVTPGPNTSIFRYILKKK